MGTFERIRTLSPWILTAFAVVFILFMALADADLGGVADATNNPQTMAIATVNDQEIKFLEYENRVKQTVEWQRVQSPDTPIDEKQIRNQIWATLINNQLVDQYSKEVGAYVTDEIAAYELLNNPPQDIKRDFMDSAGNFQRQVYIDLLTDPQGFYTQRAPDMDPTEKEKALKDFRDQINMRTAQLKNRKQQQMLTNAVNLATGIVSKAYAKENYKDENSNADAVYLSFPAASVSDDQINISDEELKSYYEVHKNSYEQEATRKLKYVAFRVQPSSRDTANMMKKQNLLQSLLTSAADSSSRDSIFTEKLRDYAGETSDYTLVSEIDPRLAQFVVNFNKGDIKGPINASDGTYFIRVEDIRTGENKVVKASHILVKFNENKDSAMTESLRIMKEAKAGDFSQLASKYSQDPGSARNGGDLGFFGAGQMVPEFEKAAFAANVGDIVGPVETQFGYHIIKVDDSQSKEYKYSYVRLTPSTSGITKNQIIRDAASFKKQLEEGENIDSLASRLGINVQETAAFTKERATLTSQYLTDISFQSKKGDVLEALELDNYGYIVAIVADAQKKGISPFEVVEEKVKAAVRKEKALDLQLEKANEVFNKVKSIGNLVNVAEVDPSLNVKTASSIKNNGIIPGGGRDFIFTNAVMDAEVNTIVSPIKGENAVYILQVTNKSKPGKDKIENSVAMQREQLKAKFSRESYFLWLQQVKKDANIEDMRYKQSKSY